MNRKIRSSQGSTFFNKPFKVRQGGVSADNDSGQTPSKVLSALSTDIVRKAFGAIDLDKDACIDPALLGQTGAIYNAVYGKRVLQPNEVATYVIKNYDSSRFYEIIPVAGTIISRRDSVVTYQAGSTPGYAGFTINGVMENLIIYDSSSTNIPNPPTIVSPGGYPASMKRSDLIKLSAFSMQTGAGIHDSTEFQLSSNISFSSILADTVVSYDDLLSWSPSQFAEGGTYYIRARYIDIAKGAGPWSSPLQFKITDDQIPNRQVQVISPSDGGIGSMFGEHIEVNDDVTRIAIAAPQQNGRIGAVYIYALVSGTWTLETKLTPPSGQSGALFGKAMAFNKDGSILIIGAPGSDTVAGTVYYYTRTGTNWALTQTILSPDSALANQQFGASVDISTGGARIVIGAKRSSKTLTDGGSAYVYSRTTGNYNLESALDPSGNLPYADLGWSISISGDGLRIAIGAPEFNNGAGCVFIYAYGTSWVKETAIAPAAAINTTPYFGKKVRLNTDGSILAIASPGESIEAQMAGALYLFNRSSGGAWSQTDRIVSKTPYLYDYYAYSFSMTRDATMFAASVSPGVNQIGEVEFGTISNGKFTVLDTVQADDSFVGNYFGRSTRLAAGGKYLFAASPFIEDDIGDVIGSVYVFASP